MDKRQRIRKAIIIITFLLFPIIIFYFSPYLIVLGAVEGIVAGSAISFTLLFIISLFLGRSPCGYFCPVSGLQECLMLVNNKKAKRGWRSLIKYCIWTLWISTIIFLYFRSGESLKLDFFFHTQNGVSLYDPLTYIIYYSVILIMVAIPLIMGKRAFCHYVCWISPFMIIGTKVSDFFGIPKLHLKSNKEDCIGCNKCSEKCPMSLNVKEMVINEKMKNTECILCGECINACPKNAIEYTFKNSPCVKNK